MSDLQRGQPVTVVGFVLKIEQKFLIAILPLFLASHFHISLYLIIFCSLSFFPIDFFRLGFFCIPIPPSTAFSSSFTITIAIGFSLPSACICGFRSRRDSVLPFCHFPQGKKKKRGQRIFGGELWAEPATVVINWSYRNVGCES